MNDEDVNQLMQETSIHYENRMKKLVEENHHLKRQLSNTNKENKKLKRIINKKNKQDKQHYKNGKRGSNLNGG